LFSRLIRHVVFIILLSVVTVGLEPTTNGL